MSNSEPCAICFKKIHPGDQIGIYPCMHYFCEKCIRTWRQTELPGNPQKTKCCPLLCGQKEVDDEEMKYGVLEI